MTLKRIGTLAAVLLTSSACSYVPMGPTAYSALPSSTATGLQPVAVQGAGSAAQPAEGDFALGPVVIPGMPRRQEADIGRNGLNPAAVLDDSARTRMGWKALHPEDLQERSVLASRSARSIGADGVTMSAASNARAAAADRPPASVEAPANYDREAAMSALLKGGQDAARHICSGC